MTYTIGKSRAFIVTRPKLREVFCADFRDRIVHHLLIRKFNNIFESLMIDSSYSCREGKGTLHGAIDISNQIVQRSDNYTKETWLLKCDLKGFFMSINRHRLYELIKHILLKRYHQPDLNWWLWLWKLVILNAPEKNCVRCGDLTLWNRLPKDKSLFHSGGNGLPIGNLTSQILANVFLTPFDKFIVNVVKSGYGRYVDDFILIDNDKQKLLKCISVIRQFLKVYLGLILHPNKIYLQECHKGVSIIGSYIMPGRIYSTNRCIDHMMSCIISWNHMLDIKDIEVKQFIQKINSYFGFVVHTNSYAIRYRMWNLMKHKDIIYCSKMKVIKQI